MSPWLFSVIGIDVISLLCFLVYIVYFLVYVDYYVFLGECALQFQRICLFVCCYSTAHGVLSFIETVAVLVTFDYYCFVDVLGPSSKKIYMLLLPPNFIF